MLKIFQIYYLEEQKNNLLEGFTPIFNPSGSIFLENELMIKLFKKSCNEDFEWFGVFSHKVSQKMRTNFCFNHLKLASGRHSQFDILGPRTRGYPWQPTTVPHNPRIFHSNENYPGMWECLDLILKKLNIPDKGNGNHLNSKVNMIYTNSFLCKKSVMKDYIDKILQPTIDLIQLDEEVKALAFKSSDYETVYEFPENLAKSTGLTTWPHIPFLLERMINVYLLTYNKKTAFVL